MRKKKLQSTPAKRYPGLFERPGKGGESSDVAAQLASLRKISGLSQKEVARRVGTSQQQISRLESSSYESHSLTMLRRVAKALGAVVRVAIHRAGERIDFVAAESQAPYGAPVKDLPGPHGFLAFEHDFARKNKVNFKGNLRMVEGLYREAVRLGVFPLKNPLDGIEVDLRIAKAVNHV